MTLPAPLTRHNATRVVLASIAALIFVLLPLTPAPEAAAAPSVRIDGPGDVNPNAPTTVTLNASGFQAIRNGFGGVYVLFGWVGEGWRPSEGGVVGENYGYVPDTEARDNNGYQRFIAFEGSDTASAAHAIMKNDGSWSVQMVIPGAKFSARDRDGNEQTVDCLKVQCGVLTIGAHGVKNPANESFTPVSFAAASEGQPEAQGGPGSPEKSAEAGDVAPGAASPAPRAAASEASATLGYVPESAVAGNALAFTGRDFAPGEQVIATLDNGVVAVGPLGVGQSGEVAAVMQLPADIAAGTHLLRLEGAGSGKVAESEVTITGAAGLMPSSGASAQPVWPFFVLAGSLLVLLVLVTIALTRWIARRMRERKARRASDEPQAQSTRATPAASGEAASATVRFERIGS